MIKMKLIFTLFLLFLHLQSIYTSSSTHFTVKTKTHFLSKAQTKLQTTVQEDSSSIASVIFGPLFGCIFFIFSIIMLWKNERGYVITSRRLTDQMKICETLDPYTLSSENQGKLTYCTASTSCDENLQDKEFKEVTTFNAVKLIRKVEMHQWKEKRERNDNRDSYSYGMVWSEDFINSDEFHQQTGHQNVSTNFFIKSEDILAKDVHFGQYFLSDELKKLTKNQTAIVISEKNLTEINPKLNSLAKETSKITFLQDNFINISKDKFQNNSGDLRISFFEVKCGLTTVVAQLENNSFVNHIIEGAENEAVDIEVCDNSRGWCYNCWNWMCNLAGSITKPISEILWIFEKTLTKDEVFEEVMRDHQNKRNWLRFLGWFLCCLGIGIFFSPISELLSLIPLIGSLLSTLFSWVVLIFALILGTGVSFMTMGIAWFFYRPLISIAVITLSVGLTVGLSLS